MKLDRRTLKTGDFPAGGYISPARSWCDSSYSISASVSVIKRAKTAVDCLQQRRAATEIALQIDHQPM